MPIGHRTLYVTLLKEFHHSLFDPRARNTSTDRPRDSELLGKPLGKGRRFHNAQRLGGERSGVLHRLPRGVAPRASEPAQPASANEDLGSNRDRLRTVLRKPHHVVSLRRACPN